jgi:hypothetical protein
VEVEPAAIDQGRLPTHNQPYVQISRNTEQGMIEDRITGIRQNTQLRTGVMQQKILANAPQTLPGPFARAIRSREEKLNAGRGTEGPLV